MSLLSRSKFLEIATRSDRNVSPFIPLMSTHPLPSSLLPVVVFPLSPTSRMVSTFFIEDKGGGGERLSTPVLSARPAESPRDRIAFNSVKIAVVSFVNARGAVGFT